MGTSFRVIPAFVKEALMELFYERELEPSVICESAGTQAEDAAEMKRFYDGLFGSDKK